MSDRKIFGLSELWSCFPPQCFYCLLCSASSRTPKSRNGSKKSTPVRSIETQTPTQLDVNEKSASSPQTPKTLLKVSLTFIFTRAFYFLSLFVSTLHKSVMKTYFSKANGRVLVQLAIFFWLFFDIILFFGLAYLR